MTYESIGTNYATQRRPDPRVQEAIWAALGDSDSVANIGAGTGSYEPATTIVAVEPSSVMIRQRPAGAAPAVQAVAEDLPLRTGCVHACLAVLTVHHWTDPAAGLAELMRVSRRRVVVLTWEQAVLDRFWLRDYFPAAFALNHARGVDVMELARDFGTVTVSPVLVPWDCQDGFGAAYWGRPAAYPDPDVRQSISSFALLAPGDVEPGAARLAADLASGAWQADHGALLELREYDAGYRLVVIDQ